MWHHYELDNVAKKTAEPLTLWQTEKGIVEIGKDALAIAIKMGDKQEGCVFHGRGRLVLDTIVETDKGAIGKPVEKEVKEPFLMLGGMGKLQTSLSAASDDDLARMGYANQKEFTARSEAVIDKFFTRGRLHDWGCYGEQQGSIFAFQNEANKLDILVTDDHKLVYKTASTIYISDGSKVVLKSPEQIVLVSSGKSIIVKSPCHVVCHHSHPNAIL
jgi:hypothetical protein